MSKASFCHKSLFETVALLKKGEISSVEATNAYLTRIHETNKVLNSLTTVCDKEALEQAQKIDEKRSKKENIGVLEGAPLIIKDVIATKGVRTTCGSKMLENFIPYYDATVSHRLKDEGAVFLGKSNMDEFAMGSSNENSYFGVVKNPWDLERTPGGSSGGSAAAVASHQGAAALGSDTGGSVRLPASYCGIVGLKPTYGRVSRYGLVAFASSLDQIGPMTQDIRDAAFLSQVLFGHDSKDSNSSQEEVPDFLKVLGKGVKGLKVGVPSEYFQEGLNKEVEDSVKKSISLLEKSGAEVFDIALPHTKYSIATYYIIATSEVSSNLARYDGIRYGYSHKGAEDIMNLYFMTREEGFGKEVKRRIMLGTFSLSSGYYDAYYKKAAQLRTLIKNDFENAFKKVDVIVTPTAPDVAFKLGEKVSDPLQMYLSDVYTTSINLAGLPALSMPCGFNKKGLPIGVQLITPWFYETTLFQVGDFLEKELSDDLKGFQPKI
ncbi:MAG TPA: Asp-tRNA(Asn)/Glu-tRNA(Gln) amidotransferase subunit GatA [Bdellovibrionota bacterium]|nr:Asp-tRNA(Asn)/Glu-tRNA(Gln) amidotransferase subunit GatA [Bdellovibrionota bacterium]